MPAMKRFKTNYPGVFYINGISPLTGKSERIFYIIYRKNGKLVEEKCGRQVKDDMTAAKASRIRAERIKGNELPNRERRIKEVEQRQELKNRWTFNRLWDEYKARKPSSKSLAADDYRYKKHIQPLFGEKEPQEISHFEIDKLRIDLLKTKKPQTVKHVLTLIRRISNFAVNKGLCDGISFKYELPTVNNKKTEDLSPSQLKSLIDAIALNQDNPAANMMELVLYTGMRRSELFRLKWQDVDFDRGFIHIRDPKGGPDQVIPLNISARKLLEKISRSSNPLVFPDKKGKQRYQITNEANQIKKQAGIPDDFRAMHGLRHVFASMLASSGQVDMYTLQKLLTHKSPLMTQRYAHLRDETLKKASNLAGELINQLLDTDIVNKQCLIKKIDNFS